MNRLGGWPERALAILLVLHALRCLFLFDPVQGVLSRDPIVVQDYSWHFYGAVLGAEHFRHAGRLWGYDPEFMAGWMDAPATPPANFPLKALFVALDGHVSRATAMRIFVLLCAALSPCFFALGAHLLGWRGWYLTFSTALALFYWWLGNPYRMMKWGMWLYPASCYLAILVQGLLASSLRRPGAVRCLLAGGGLGFCVFLHGASVFPLFAPCVALVVPKVRSHVRWIVLWGFCASLSLLPTVYNVYYLSWIFLQRGYVNSTDITSNLRGAFGPAFPILDLLDYRRVINAPQEAGRASLEAALYLLAGHWILMWIKGRNRRFEDVSVLVAALTTFVMAYYGFLFPIIRELHTYRFKINLFLFLALLSGPSLVAIFREATIVRTWKRVAWATPCLIGLMIASWHLAGNIRTWRPIDGRIPNEARALVDWISLHTDDTGRVLIEDSGHMDREGFGVLKYFGGYFPSLIPMYTGRELIGGPQPYMGGVFPGPAYVVQAAHASFADGYLFRQDVSELSKPYVQQMFAAYNIRWVITWSARSLRFFSVQSDWVKPLGTLGYFNVYEVLREGNFFLKGSGTCSAGPDEIRLSHIVPEDGEIVLAYHWFDVLETVPACDMDGFVKPMNLVDDPVPFIRIKNPPQELTVRTRGYVGPASRGAGPQIDRGSLPEAPQEDQSASSLGEQVL